MGISNVLGLNGYAINNSNYSNSSILEFLPPELISRIESLVTLLKITGIVIIGYIIFLLLRWIFSIRRHRKITKIYKKVYDIDKKLDVLLKRKPVKEPVKKANKSSNKEPGLISRLFKKEHPKFKKTKK